MIISRVPFEFVHQRWPEVAPHFQLTGEWSGEWTVEQLKTLLFAKQQVLIIAEEDGQVCGACSVVFNNTPSHRVAFITMIGGKMLASRDNYDQLCALLKTYGATYVEGAARESIARLWSRFGLQEKYRIVGAPI